MEEIGDGKVILGESVSKQNRLLCGIQGGDTISTREENN